MEEELLCNFPWHQVTACMGMFQSCIREGSDWKLGSIYFFNERMVKHWNRIPGERWSMPQAS